MHSPSRSSSQRRKSSAATIIQRRFRSKQTRKQKQRSKASQRIQTRVRGIRSRKLISRVKDNMVKETGCPICLQPMTKTEKVATLLPCGHRYHTQCIRDGLDSTGGLCAYCKSVVTNIQPRRISLQEVQQAQQQVAQLLENQQRLIGEVITMSERLRSRPLSENEANLNNFMASAQEERAANHYRLVNASRSSGTISEQQWQNAQDLSVDARSNMFAARAYMFNFRRAI